MSGLTYDIELTGLDAAPGAIDAPMLRDLLDALIEAAGRALRLSVEGTSTRPGPQPDWIERSVQFTVLGLRKGSTVLPIEAPLLGDTAGFVISQQDIWQPKPEPEDTSLSLLARVMRDVEAENRESELYDRGVLQAIEDFGRVVKNGEVITIRNTKTSEPTFAITHNHIQQAECLKRDTPDPRAVIVSGWLDVIEHSQRAFSLRTEDGRKIKGIVRQAAVSSERLRDLWGKKVTLQGHAHFTPAQSMRIIETRVIRPFRERDQIFERSKTELEKEASVQMSGVHPPLEFSDAGDALRAIRGKWPGEESIEEILDALN